MKLESIKMQAYREKWLSRGQCPYCGEHRPVAEGRKKCVACAGKQNRHKRERYQQRRLAGVCVQCNGPIEPERAGMAYCERCGEMYNRAMRKAMRARSELNREQYHARKAEGICPQCGRPVEPERAGKVYCAVCAGMRTASTRRYKGRKHEQKIL